MEKYCAMHILFMIFMFIREKIGNSSQNIFKFYNLDRVETFN